MIWIIIDFDILYYSFTFVVFCIYVAWVSFTSSHIFPCCEDEWLLLWDLCSSHSLLKTNILVLVSSLSYLFFENLSISVDNPIHFGAKYLMYTTNTVILQIFYQPFTIQSKTFKKTYMSDNLICLLKHRANKHQGTWNMKHKQKCFCLFSVCHQHHLKTQNIVSQIKHCLFRETYFHENVIETSMFHIIMFYNIEKQKTGEHAWLNGAGGRF